jgi:hypothetical protein
MSASTGGGKIFANYLKDATSLVMQYDMNGTKEREIALPGIDTAPVGLVSDAVPLIRQSDINVFVIRSGVSRNNAASIPGRLNNEYHLNNVVIILNAFGNEMLHSSFYNSSYNDKNYAYYYYADYNGYGNEGYFENGQKRKWYQFWRKRES